MRADDARHLVIDASVARAAGGQPGVSSECRLFLEAVLEICHHVVFTPALLDEWRRHESAAARRWLRGMFARRKVHRAQSSGVPGLATALDDFVRALPGTQAPDVRAKIQKDLPLVEAAVAGDKVVVSLDEDMRGWLSQLAGRAGDLRRIAWVNPTTDPPQNEAWLASGARPLRRHLLGAAAPDA